MIYRTKVSKDDPIAVIGTPRSGTGYAAHFFDIGHEEWTDRGIASWLLVSSPKREGDLTLEDIRRKFPRVQIMHQTRDPLKTIASCTTLGLGSWRHIARNLDLSLSDGKLRNSMIFWVEWNKLAEKQTNFRYRVEDIDETFPNEEGYENKKHNHRKHVDFTAGFLKRKNPDIWEQVEELALSYGYQFEE
jgi:hypothetical protein